MNLFRKLKL